MLDELSAERQIMDDILPEYSGLFPFTDLIIGYSNADDGKAFFDTSIDEMEWFDEMRRFAGFRYFEMGEYDLATILLGGVEVRKPKDYLASALAKIKAGDYELASQIIEEYANIDWPRLKSEDIFIQYQLYQLLQKQRELTFNEQKNVEELKAQLTELEHIDLDSNRILDTESFCADSMRD